MKLIKPMDGVENATTSDAPMDALATWEPEGRDLLDYLDKPIFDVAGNTLVAVSENGGEVYRQDLATGVTSKVGHSVVGPVHNLSISPDALLLCAVSNSSGDYKVEILQSVGGQVKYSGVRSAFRSSASNLGDANRDGVQWGAGSAYFAEGSAVRSIDTTTWVASTIFDVGAIPLADINGEWTEVFGGSVKSLLSASGSIYASGSVYGESFYGGAGDFSADRGFTIKMNAAGAVSVYSFTFDTQLAPWLRWNSERTEVMAFRKNGIFPLNPSSLAPLSAGAAPESGIFTAKSQSIKITDTHLITRSLSTSPFWNYRLLTDYSLDKSLPALPDRGEGIAVGTTYTVVQQNQGVAVIKNADDSIQSQQSPNVTKGDTYIYQDHVYEALADGNDKPDAGTLLDPPTWLDRGFINPLRMFDGKLESRTTAQSPLTITVTPGMITNGLALFNVSAASVQVVMDDPTDGQVYDSGEIQMLDNSAVNNWWDFFFAPYLEKDDLALIDLPPYPDATLTITLSSDGGEVALGELVLGRVQNIGEAQYGTSVGIIDSSTKERDVFGNFEIIERKFSKRAEFDVSVPTSSASGMQRILAQYRATPVVWVGNMGLEATIVYGFYRDFQINFSHYSLSDATITVEGL